MATALALRGLQAFGLPEHQERIARRVESARGWLMKTPARDTEDRVFRLLGLKAAGAPAEEIRRAGAELAGPSGRRRVGADRHDGERRLRDRSALAALQMGADMPVADPAYRRGVAYLLRTQLDAGRGGSGRGRSPFQPYYESGFPAREEPIHLVCGDRLGGHRVSSGLPGEVRNSKGLPCHWPLDCEDVTKYRG